MGLARRLLRNTAIGTAGAAGAFAYLIRNSSFVPLSPQDPIFASAAYRRNNPDRNPATQDLCVRTVPLNLIKPHLLENDGKLVETFCAGVWGGLGYAYQRSYLAKKYQNESTGDHLWTRKELQDSTYDVGTLITDHFEVVSKTPESIVVRCGDSPSKQGRRDSDGLFEMVVVVKPAEGVAEFQLKSVFYKGLGSATEPPMPSHVEFAHRVYTKLLMETAVRRLAM